MIEIIHFRSRERFFSHAVQIPADALPKKLYECELVSARVDAFCAAFHIFQHPLHDRRKRTALRHQRLIGEVQNDLVQGHDIVPGQLDPAGLYEAL